MDDLLLGRATDATPSLADRAVARGRNRRQMSSGGRTLPAALVLLAWSAPADGSGVTGPPLGLRAEGCGAHGEKGLRRSVARDLGRPVEEVDPAHAPTGVRALVACLGDAAEIAVVDARTAKAEFRRVSFEGVEPGQRARVASRAVVDLFEASWPEPAKPEPAKPDPPPVQGGPAPLGPGEPAATAALGPAKGPPPRKGGPAFSVSGQVAGALHGFRTLGGGAIGIAHEPWGSGLLADLELGGAAGSQERLNGKVSVKLAALGADVGWRWRRQLVFLDASLGLRAGWAWLSGMPKDAESWSGRASGPWTGSVARLGVGLGLRPVAPSLSIELGHVIQPVRGLIDGEGELGMAGSWIGVKLKLSWRGKGWARW